MSIMTEEPCAAFIKQTNMCWRNPGKVMQGNSGNSEGNIKQEKKI